MMHSRLALFAALFLFVATATIHAGDFANLNFIGFSKDGKYLAFEEYGTQDGSGWTYSNYYFIDVAKNAHASKTVSSWIKTDNATEQQARSKSKVAAATTIRRLRILDRNTGTAVVSRQLTDVSGNHALGSDAGKTQKIEFAEIIGSMYRRGDYELILDPSDLKGVKRCDYNDDPIQKLELSLRDKDQNKTTVLQKDATVPESRGCPLNYAVQHVYLYDNYIAVFVNTYSFGFEGPDMRYMVVTGSYK